MCGGLAARGLPQQTQSPCLRAGGQAKALPCPALTVWRQENTGDDLGQPLGRRDAEGSKGRSLPGCGLARLSGGASEVLGRAAWAPVLHLLLGHSESPAWPPGHSDNRKVNIPPPPGQEVDREEVGLPAEPPQAGTARQGLFIPWLGAWLGCALTRPAGTGAFGGQWRGGTQRLKWHLQSQALGVGEAPDI